MDTTTTNGTSAHKLSDGHAHGLVTRTLDAVDRAHARTATKLHDGRNAVIKRLETTVDRLETVMTQVFERARKGLQRVDAVSADFVNRSQGAVGQAIERARLARTSPDHVAS
jgi:t-SNARE complex subunit (syntaxin)